ncbi:LuxR C-terminal-related transcriptional regulator [Micromonospora sp. CA-248260]|uniref:helix-turn-helix transcriptional regulator n=1 Tax=unclassified Micromonospora TaxID=2617518 RepID=UPI00343BC1C7
MKDDRRPLEALLDLLERHEEAQVGAAAAIRSVRAKVAALATCGWPVTAGATGIEEVAGWSRMEELLKNAAVHAAGEMMWMDPPAPAQQIVTDAVNRHRTGIDAGLVIRVIRQNTSVGAARIAGPLQKMASVSVQVRSTQLVPFRFLVVDDDLALIWPTGPGNRISGHLLVRQETVVALLRRVFEFCWSTTTESPTAMTPGVAPDDRDPIVRYTSTDLVDSPLRLTEQQLMILRLWARGRPDTAIARELQLSARTLRRLVSALLRRLGTSSRFEAGVVAGRIEGLLDFPS